MRTVVFSCGCGLGAATRVRVVVREGIEYSTRVTGGPKDNSRAWAIHQGSTAVEAVGKIRTGFARGFIKTEVVSFADIDQYGGEAAARTRGRLRIEGKEYALPTATSYTSDSTCSPSAAVGASIR